MLIKKIADVQDLHDTLLMWLEMEYEENYCEANDKKYVPEIVDKMMPELLQKLVESGEHNFPDYMESPILVNYIKLMSKEIYSKLDDFKTFVKNNASLEKLKNNEKHYKLALRTFFMKDGKEISTEELSKRTKEADEAIESEFKKIIDNASLKEYIYNEILDNIIEYDIIDYMHSGKHKNYSDEMNDIIKNNTKVTSNIIRKRLISGM